MTVYRDPPVPMLLNCPVCGMRHIDRGEFATKHHHTHACQECGTVWRPAIHPTIGVRFLPGFRDHKPFGDDAPVHELTANETLQHTFKEWGDAEKAEAKIETGFRNTSMAYFQIRLRQGRMNPFLEWLHHRGFMKLPGTKVDLIGNTGVTLWIRQVNEGAVMEYMRQEIRDEVNDKE